MEKNYIPCIESFLDFSSVNSITPGYCTPIKKFPIDKIKFNKKYLSYPNPVLKESVDWIVNDFHHEGWEPIFLNPKKYLIDGQHRLAAAKRMGLKYIDIVIINEKAASKPQKTKRKMLEESFEEIGIKIKTKKQITYENKLLF